MCLAGPLSLASRVGSLSRNVHSGVWLAFDAGNEATFRSLPSWLLEVCMRGGIRPSDVFFQQQQPEDQQQHHKLQQSTQPEKQGDASNDVEMQSFGRGHVGVSPSCCVSFGLYFLDGLCVS